MCWVRSSPVIGPKWTNTWPSARIAGRSWPAWPGCRRCCAGGPQALHGPGRTSANPADTYGPPSQPVADVPTAQHRAPSRHSNEFSREPLQAADFPLPKLPAVSAPSRSAPPKADPARKATLPSNQARPRESPISVGQPAASRQLAASRSIKVFLCHSSSYKPSVRALRSRLLNDGIQPWFDEEDIIPGQDWDLEIRKAIRASDIVLVCLSVSSVTRVGYLQREIRNVLDVADEQPEGSIFLIPIRLEPVGVPERLRRWQWVDLFEDNGYPRLMRALQTVIQHEYQR